MVSSITETTVEQALLDWLQELGYASVSGATIAPGEPLAERETYAEVVLVGRLREVLTRINPHIPFEAREEALRKVMRAESPSIVEANRRFHPLLTDGVDVEYHAPDGRIVHDKVWLVDWDDPGRNDWLAVNQFTIVEHRRERRPDVVIFVNGLPLAVIELKNPLDEKATIRGAFNQLQTYKQDVPTLFPYNEVLVISDGREARRYAHVRLGSLHALAHH